MKTVDDLIDAVEREARREPFPIDVPVYEKAGRDPHVPVLFAGALEARVCVVGRDLGRDEVAAGQPLIGAGGRLVRAGVFRAVFGQEPPSPAIDRPLARVLDHVLLTNTVPYKPPGNKAYAPAVRERFRPFLAALLVAHWQGDRVLTLGNEAFQWFARYAPDALAFETLWGRDDRYEASIACEVAAEADDGRAIRRTLLVQPLPHPSPLNARWYRQFPGLLARRLADLPGPSA